MANATMSKDEILEAIGNMSVFELAELIDNCVVLVEESSSANLRWAGSTLTTNGAVRGRSVEHGALRGEPDRSLGCGRVDGGGAVDEPRIVGERPRRAAAQHGRRGDRSRGRRLAARERLLPVVDSDHDAAGRWQ